MARMANSTCMVALAVGLVGVGCTTSHPTPAGPNTAAVEVPDDRNDPIVKEARSDTEAVLNDLLAGKYDNDPNFAPVARKLKGFRSWSIERQNIDPDNRKAVNFRGTLKGPQGEATFVASMVKQQNGKWMIGYFQGPDPKRRSLP
jgi:hypothetical protein